MILIVLKIFLIWKKLLLSYAASAVLMYHKALGRTAIGPTNGSLTITDNRTRRSYQIPIVRNSVRAIDFRQITAAQQGADVVDQFDNGLLVLDKGYLNTACMESSITLM
jgi:citrate synthase